MTEVANPVDEPKAKAEFDSSYNTTAVLTAQSLHFSENVHVEEKFRS